jgi:hypothetical protein
MSLDNLDNFIGVHRTYYNSGEIESEVFINNCKKDGKK